MNNLKNSVRLVGNVGTTPEIIDLGENKKVAKFPIAINSTYKKGDEKVTKTMWVNIVAWNGTATIVEKYLEKGNEVVISGSLNCYTYEDKDGNKRFATDVNAKEILITSRSKQTTEETTEVAEPTQAKKAKRTKRTKKGKQTLTAEQAFAEDFAKENSDDLPF